MTFASEKLSHLITMEQDPISPIRVQAIAKELTWLVGVWCDDGPVREGERVLESFSASGEYAVENFLAKWHGVYEVREVRGRLFLLTELQRSNPEGRMIARVPYRSLTMIQAIDDDEAWLQEPVNSFIEWPSDLEQIIDQWSRMKFDGRAKNVRFK